MQGNTVRRITRTCFVLIPIYFGVDMSAQAPSKLEVEPWPHSTALGSC